jgi:hypothetical protein
MMQFAHLQCKINAHNEDIALNLYKWYDFFPRMYNVLPHAAWKHQVTSKQVGDEGCLKLEVDA